MAVTTYPGTASPLRGLQPYTSAERDVFWGREHDTAELTRLVTSNGYRAGLLHGPAGSGKTSLLAAGLIPHLRDHGVVALLCRDNTSPATALAQEFSATTNQLPRENENPVAFLGRSVAEALRKQQYLFILDDIEVALSSQDDGVVAELADLFARVVTRSGGRARFLFCCESSQLHTFSVLERRTGSLFPPSSRFELGAFDPDTAASVFERMMTLTGTLNDAQTSAYVATNLNRGAPVLPADLQIAALAMPSLKALTVPAIDDLGGPPELAKAWVAQCATATGDERAALRLLSQLAEHDGGTVVTATGIAPAANVEPSFAASALESLTRAGVLRQQPPTAEGELCYRLAHPILAPRVLELAAPAQAAARRAFELLGSKVESGGRLSLREWIEVKQQRLEPSSPQELAVLERTRRFATIIVGLAIAVPIALLIIIYISNSGRYYTDVATIDGSERVVVRDGRPGLSMFHWLGFGDIVADTGFDQQMVSGDAWASAADEDLTFGSDGLEATALGVLDGRTRNLVGYAIDGSETALEALRAEATSAEELAEMLDVLAMLGRGGPAEIEIINAALADGSPAVRISALQLATRVEARRPNTYLASIAGSLASDKAQTRRLTASVVRGLPDKLSQRLWDAALERATDTDARSELLARAGGGAATSLDAGQLTATLADPNASEANRKTAWAKLRRLLSARPSSAVPTIAELAANAEAPKTERIAALEALFVGAIGDHAAILKERLASLAGETEEGIKAAALPLLARSDPATYAGELANLDPTSLSPALRAAVALAWGEVATVEKAVAQSELDKLIVERRATTRAAAARAYGKLGRASQAKLVDMTKKERLDVAEAAAMGLVESARAGASVNVVAGGLGALWRKKGRSKRAAARAFAELARTHPRSIMAYVAAASRDRDDSALHAIGVNGLCNALAADNKRATRDLLTVAGLSDSADLRRRIADCATDHLDSHPADAIRLADKLLRDSDATVRLQAASVLASLARDEEARESVGAQLAVALGDPSRAVRVVAADAIGELGTAAPDVADRLPAIFARAEEAEKLALMRAAAAVGAAPLVPLAMGDTSERVRVAGLRVALGQADLAEEALQSALTDASPGVRRAALDLLATTKLRAGIKERALGLATRDASAEIANEALAQLAAIGAPDAVAAQLERMLASRSDADRRAAASAARGLAIQQPARAEELLAPVLRDSARDVRAAAAISLGYALAQKQSVDELAKALRRAEKAPARRIAIAAAFVLVAKENSDGALAALKEIADGGPALAAITAQITSGLISGRCDALEFLNWLAP